jgi:protein transport protein SEC61 subunit alpha
MSGGFRVINLVRPFLAVLPEVEAPTQRVSFQQRAIYTAVALFIFLVCSQLPLYGIQTAAGSDPFYWARVIMASNRGTLMELGISPIMTSGLVMQLLVGAKIIDLDTSAKQDRDLL